MYINGKLLIGKNDKEELYLLPNKANRHGIITGASGSGKTTTLKVMAESFSSAGVPVFLIDIKGDLAGTAYPGVEKDFIKARIEDLKLDEFKYQGFPVTFFDLYGKNGHPIRTTVEDIGPRLFAKMLDLTEAQTGVLSIVFQIAKDENLKIIDLKDFKKLLSYVGENRSKYTLDYGNISSQSIGSIQRNLLTLEQEGGSSFFGKPSFELKDLIHFDAHTGKGFINIFDSQELFKKPILYAVFLIWLLNAIYDSFPEVGDLAKPKLVLFFDEAHLMFSEMPNYVIKQVTQIVKLIRSKGVGIYFISQSPSDVPDEILSQLGNKIQHTLRSYTPSDDKIVKAAASSFRKNPSFDTVEEIKNLKTGEALISFLDESGMPGLTEKAFILPPESRMGVITDIERKSKIQSSYLYNKYENLYDEESAFEKLKAQDEAKKVEEKKVEEKKTATKKETKEKEKTVNKYAKKIANSTASTIGRKIGNQIFKSLFK